MSDFIKVMEVGPRDGLQNETKFLSTDHKIQFIKNLANAGLPVIEATAFVSPKWVPQMKDAKEVLKGISEIVGPEFPVLVPNMKGLELAKESGAKHVAFFTTASETFSKKNKNRSIAEDLKELKEMIKIAHEEFNSTRIYISTCYICPFEGAVDPNQIQSIVEELLTYGASWISLADTVGRANPEQVKGLFKKLRYQVDFDLISMHFHDTSEGALDNVKISLDSGVKSFESSAGGLGGCPYAPGASGNLATEKLLGFLHENGFETGVNIDKVRQASNEVKSHLN